jgi:hypothetical protein
VQIAHALFSDVDISRVYVQRVLLPHIAMDEHEFAAGLADRMFRAASGKVVSLFVAS